MSCEIAQNLARNCGYAVFPCKADKSPATPHGYKDASCDPEVIATLWRGFPGPLIGVATGAISGFDCLDIDRKHAIAMQWWHVAARRTPRTRVYRTRSGGRHVLFRHTTGVGNTTSKLAKGVDTRGDGGYIVFWYATGCPCFCHDPPAPWPSWLLDALLRKAPPSSLGANQFTIAADRAIDGILDKVRQASEGDRNSILFWAANRLRERAIEGQIARGDAQLGLLNAALSTGLEEKHVRKTIASAWREST